MARIAAQWFDGRSARAQPVEVWLDDAGLHFGDQLAPRAGLTWPERQRHGQRQILLPGGGVLVFTDGPAFDAWALASGRHEAAVVGWQQSWCLTLMALVLLLAVLAVGWRWGLPWAVDHVVALTPVQTERVLGSHVLESLDQALLKPSQLKRAQQQRIEARFAAAIDAALDAGAMPAIQSYTLHFRDGGKALGPNAFALPGGDIVVTDALVELLADTPDGISGVLAHELGHVQRRHALRHTLRASAVGVVAGFIVGDFSSLLAGAPALLASQAYSRDFEREADAYARTLLRGAGLDAAVMVVFFERVARRADATQGDAISIAISSHPADAERIRFFQER
jgi:Zn-dependent protease with chaperone function